MIKEIFLCVFFCCMVSCTPINETLHIEKRSDKVSAGKLAIATGLMRLGQMAVSQMGGK